MHPIDYALLQQAAESQKQSLADFILLAAYFHARDVLAEAQARTGSATPIAHHQTANAPTTPLPSA